MIGTDTEAFSKDYLNKDVWNMPVDFIAIVRHQDGVADAVKVFQFKQASRSMLERFQDMDPWRRIETEEPLYESIGVSADNLEDDPIFSVGGGLAFNWRYSDNGCRIAMAGGFLSDENANDDNTHGLGNDFSITASQESSYVWDHEISNIQDCALGVCTRVMMQGTDHGAGSHLISGPVYGYYAIYVTADDPGIPQIRPGIQLELAHHLMYMGTYIFSHNARSGYYTMSPLHICIILLLSNAF